VPRACFLETFNFITDYGFDLYLTPKKLWDLGVIIKGLCSKKNKKLVFILRFYMNLENSIDNPLIFLKTNVL
jgi:hypothetical protein